jgi:hypothetical protein
MFIVTCHRPLNAHNAITYGSLQQDNAILRRSCVPFDLEVDRYVTGQPIAVHTLAMIASKESFFLMLV